jgi:Reverse transcriptase (RNA-dependent DNA polymerase)
MDVKNVFLQGTLEKKVYMTLSSGHKKENISNLICRLKKSIYGLKQFSRARKRSSSLTHFLFFCNFKVSDADSSLFIKHNCNGTTIILVYVNDLIITENNKMEIELIKRNLK